MNGQNPSLFLYGALPQAAILGTVRARCIPEESSNLERILTDWRNAANLFRDIEAQEAGAADNAQVEDVSSEYADKLKTIQENVLFKSSFSIYPTEIKLVEVDRIVATQRQVSLPYIDKLLAQIPEKPSMDALIDLCISPHHKVPDSKILQNNVNTFTFTSPSVDFRFLGGYPKEINSDDFKYALGGGLPVGALILFVGYGAGCINVLSANTRLILGDGFHRVYALRKLGVKKIPMVVQKVGNPDLEMAAEIGGLTRDYLTKHPRPVMVKDFFVPGLTTVLRLKQTLRSVRVQWGSDLSDMAI